MKYKVFYLLFSALLLFAGEKAEAQTYSKELVKRAKRGDIDAGIDLAICYGYGLGVKQNIEKATELFEKLAGSSSDYSNTQGAEAAYEYGVFLIKIKSNSFRYKYSAVAGQGVAYIHCAAERGYERAQLIFARMHRGKIWTSELCNHYYNTTYFRNNYLYDLGFYTDAVHWYQKAASQGKAAIQIEFADYLAEAAGYDPQAPEIAVYWYKTAAEQGDDKAQVKYGYCWQKGFGIQKSDEEALKWFMKAAKLGNAEGMCRVGILFLGITRSFEIENQENEFSLSEGTDTGGDERQQGIDWLKKSAELNYPGAPYYLGVFYKECERNEGEAFKWFYAGSRLENAKAYYELGRCYEEGRGCPSDVKNAAVYYEKAAQKGIKKAVEKMVYFYENGIGVYKDKQKAEEYRKEGNLLP